MKTNRSLAPLFLVTLAALVIGPIAPAALAQDDEASAAPKPTIQVRGHTRGDLTLPGLAFLQPARGLFEAYPLGNGTLATSVYGGVEHETFAIASDRIWEDWQDGERAQPIAGNLEIKFTYREGTTFVQEYTRALNFANGVSQTTFETPPAPHPDHEGHKEEDRHGPQHYRTTFASLSHDVLVYHIASDEPVSFEITLAPTENPVGPSEVVFPALGRIALNALAPKRDSETDHTAYQILCSVVPDDGSMQIGEGVIRVTDTTAALIFVAIASSLHDEPGTDAPKFTDRAAAKIDAALATVEESGVRGLVDAHAFEHERLFKKLFLRIGKSEYEMAEGQALLERYPTTSTRLAGARRNEADTYMPELLFYIGRHLQIASSYGDASPGNLQGYFGRLPTGELPPGRPETFWSAASGGMAELVHPVLGQEPGVDTARLTAALAAVDPEDPMNPKAQRELDPAMAALYFARSGQGNRALACINLFLKQVDLQPNLINQGRPLGVEANLGIAAAIGEMLFQTKDGVIEFLPALPKQWHEGQFDGFTTPSGIQAAAGWSQGQLDLCMITSVDGGTCKIRLPNKPIVAVWQEGRAFMISDLEEAANRGFPIQYKDGVASWKTISGSTYAVIPVW